MVAVLLLVAGIGFYTSSNVAGQVTDQQRETVKTNAQLEAKSLGQWLDGQKEQVRALSNHQGIDGSDPDGTRAVLDSELDEAASETAAYHYVERDSEQVLASTNRSLEGGPLNETNIWWNPEVGFSFDSSADVVESFVYSDGGDPSVALASPSPDGDHVLVVVLRTNVHAERFSSSIEGTNTVVMGGFTGLVLFDEDKQNVLTSYGGNETEPEVVDTAVERRVLESGETNGTVLTDSHVVGYTSVPGTDWIVVKEAPRSEALSVTQSVESELVILMAVILGGFIAFGAMVQFGPMQSLRQLTRSVNSIADGDLSTEIEETDRIDEIGQIQSALHETKSYLDGIEQKAKALSTQAFDDPAFEQETPGELGVALEKMRLDLEEFVDELETARREAMELSEHLQATADDHAATMQQCAAGDLTQRMDSDGQNESMDHIASEFNDMISELEKTTGQLKRFADEVEAAGEVVQHSSESVRDASEQVAESIQRISDDAHEQQEQLQSVSESMDEIAGELETVADEHGVDFGETLDRVEEIALVLGEVAELSEATMAESENVAGAAQEQAAELNEVNQRAEDLTRYASPLRDVLDRFETDSEREFFFPTGPGSDGEVSPDDD